LDAFGELVVLEPIGRLEVFVIDRIVLTHAHERRLVVQVLPLALYLLMRLGEQCHRLTSALAALRATRNTPRETRRCAVFSARSA
jgi:hypothetical protein